MITLTDVLAMSSGELIETLWNVNTDNLRAINGDGTN